MTDDTDFDFGVFHKQIWSDLITAPKPVLEALVADHEDSLARIILPMLARNADSLANEFNAMLATATSDWYVVPANKTCDIVKRLSKGFAMAASQIAVFFDDIYIGRDFKDVLLDPHSPPARYPDMASIACGYFLKTVSPFLPEGFWDRSDDLKNMETSLAFVGDFAANEETMGANTALLCLYNGQRMARVMPVVAVALREAGHANLATIASCFAAKGEAISQDIIEKTSAAIAQSRPLQITAGPSGGTAPA